MTDKEQAETEAKASRGRGVVVRRLARGVLTRQLRRSLRNGELSQEHHDALIYALKNDNNVEKILDALDEERTTRAELYKDGERPILDWIVANWPEILRVLLSLLPLLLI